MLSTGLFYAAIVTRPSIHLKCIFLKTKGRGSDVRQQCATWVDARGPWHLGAECVQIKGEIRRPNAVLYFCLPTPALPFLVTPALFFSSLFCSLSPSACWSDLENPPRRPASPTTHRHHHHHHPAPIFPTGSLARSYCCSSQDLAGRE